MTIMSNGDKEGIVERPGQSAGIQDTFLNAARKDRLSVTIYLVSGVKLSGRIRSFDKYALVLESGNQEQLIYKHAISTVVMQKMHLAHAASVAPSVAPNVAPNVAPSVAPSVARTEAQEA
jgi:host factor-I protein